MSAPINEGGPAFPVNDPQGAHRVGMAATGGTGEPESVYIAASARAMSGMTLRDYFAAQAMPFVAGRAELDHTGPAEWAAACYEVADAMIAARGGA